MTDTIHLAGTSIELHPWGVTTLFPDGLVVQAAPQDNATYRARAGELGYGADTLAMSREHEAGHAILAHLLGLKHSPTLRGVAEGAYWPEWQREEAAVLALQAYARAAGIDLIRVARRLAAEPMRSSRTC